MELDERTEDITIHLLNMPVKESFMDQELWLKVKDLYSRFAREVITSFCKKYDPAFHVSEKQFEDTRDFVMKVSAYKPDIADDEWDKIFCMHIGLFERDDKLIEKYELEFERLNTKWLQNKVALK